MSGRTLLGVWAHPDDEAYLSAGLMAEFRRNGDRVVVVTATLGERGTSDPLAWPPERLAPLRREELRQSLAAVGVDELHVLGLPDGECDQLDATDAIADFITVVRPDLVVTFGPDGMTGHPDHRAVSRWVTQAMDVAQPGTTLWYATLTDNFHRRWGRLNDEIGLWADQVEPPRIVDGDCARTTVLPDDLLELKLAALEAHASQTRPLIELVGAAMYREWWRSESFRAPRAGESAFAMALAGQGGAG